jgi:hypothetical protein
MPALAKLVVIFFMAAALWTMIIMGVIYGLRILS